MITVLNFCQKDRDLALNLLRHMQVIGTCRNHELTLQFNNAVAVMGMHQELIMLGTEMFEKCNHRMLDAEDERAWPFGANNAWRDYVYFSRVKAAQPWLWLEPDCMFIPGKGCPLCAIARAYEVCGKPFMGAEVTKPEHRMSGVAVYPAYVTFHTKKLPSLNPPPKSKLRGVAWDQYLAGDIVPNAAFTPLIQHVWNVELGKPETIPTFPTQESLKLIGPQTVLFHRCKDGSGIERFREHNAPALAADRSLAESSGPVEPSLGAGAPSREAELLARISSLEAELKRPLLSRLAYDGIVGHLAHVTNPNPFKNPDGTLTTAGEVDLQIRMQEILKRTLTPQMTKQQRGMAKARAAKVAKKEQDMAVA